MDFRNSSVSSWKLWREKLRSRSKKRRRSSASGGDAIACAWKRRGGGGDRRRCCRRRKPPFPENASEGRRIQESMLPKKNPTIPGYRIEGRSVPSGAVGGDFFDYIPMSDGRLAMVLADVSGKGLPAALLMATTRGVLRSLARQSANAS